jgi:hypothetical protein
MIKGGPLTLGRLFAIIGKLQSKGEKPFAFSLPGKPLVAAGIFLK